MDFRWVGNAPAADIGIWTTPKEAVHLPLTRRELTKPPHETPLESLLNPFFTMCPKFSQKTLDE